MSDNDDKKRSHLRLVVNNPDKRHARPSAVVEDYMPLEDLIAGRDVIRDDYYRGMTASAGKACMRIERFLNECGRPYGLDPLHGKPIVIPVAAVCKELDGLDPWDELLAFISEDLTGEGLCLSLEMILPFYNEDESVMEEALLYSPVFQYGALFLEENRQDGYLDLVYRIGFPISPPALSGRMLERIFSIVALEIGDALRGLADYPPE
jgi:hypothetical protein